MWLPVVGVLSTLHLEGDIAPAGGDFVDVPFTVPAGTAEIRIAHSVTSQAALLDWGVWNDAGFRGWTGWLTEDIVIGIDQSSRGYLPGPIAPGVWKISIGKSQLAATGTRWIVDVTFSDQQTLPVLPRAAYQPLVMATGRRWYTGDFHVHSLHSGDGTATLQQNVDLAHSRGLDFINLSDHNTIAQHALVAAQQPSWPVLVLRSSEITTYDGHGNGVGIHDYVDHRVGYQGRTWRDLIDDTVAQGGVFLVNHAGNDFGSGCVGCAWTHIDDVPWDKIAGLEILTAGYTLGERAFTPKVIALWDMMEDRGHRLSAIGGSDDHTAGVGADGVVGSALGSPTSLVFAPELSEAAILEALRHQHTKVKLRGPDDPDVDLAIRTAAGGLAELGDDVAGVSRVEMPIRVVGGSGMFVRIWRDGAQIAQLPVTAADFTTTHEDVPGAGDHRYRAELIDEAGRRVVVTSHIYVHATEASSGGCSAAPGSPLAALPLLALGLRRRRRRRLPR